MNDNLGGQKAITPDNFVQPDSRMLYFVSNPEDWLKRCLSSDVKPQVPENVSALLRTARGTIIYAWFYYPLLTVGAEQCTRCLESAARERCKNVGIVVENIDKKGKPHAVHFGNLLAALIGRGLLTDEDAGRWDVGRNLRNMASHPDDQMIFTPGRALGLLDTTIDLINRLFAR